MVTTQGNGTTIYIGGQNAVNPKAELVGKNDIGVQSEQALKNIDIALAACGADFSNLVKLTIYIVQGQDARKGFEASRKQFAPLKHQPIISVVFAAGLVHPDYLVEIEAVAFMAAETKE